MAWKQITALALLATCTDESLTGYGTGRYILHEIDGTAYSAKAVLELGEDGAISGEAPCNLFSGALQSPYPWFEVGPLAVTRRACPQMREEQVFFASLEEMTLAEVSEGVLILSNEAGREMVFHREP